MKTIFTFGIRNKSRAYTIHLLILLLSFSSGLFAQLSGTYTIGTGGNYTTFQEAADALHDNGVSGPVTFNVQSGTYEEQVIYRHVPGADENNTITFQSALVDSTSVMVQSAAATNPDNYVMKLDSASYLTFRSITFRTLNSQFARVIALESVTDHVTFSHCAFEGSFYPYGDPFRVLVYSTKTIKSLTLDNNNFSQSSYGILLQLAWNDTLHTEITNNKFDRLGYEAIYLQAADAPVISGNVIAHGDNGIMLSHSTGKAMIRGNNIDVPKTGIFLNYFSSTDGNEAVISNNMIAINREDVTNSGNGGIYLANSNHIKVYYNTSAVYMNHYNDSRALNLATCDGGTIEVVNNNLVCLHDGYAFYSDQNTVALARCDHNNYFSASTTLAIWHGIDCADLAALKTTSGDNTNSVSADPQFLSDTDLHTKSPVLDSAAVPIDGITADIDGDLRDSQFPDIGADEFVLLPHVSAANYTEAYPLDPLGSGAGVWVDIDGDSDMDIMLSGITEDNKYIAEMLNTGDSPYNIGAFTHMRPEKADAVAWGDFDNDGKPDLIIAGSEKPGEIPFPAIKLFNNHFTEITTGIHCDFYYSVDWGDYDNDGDADLLLTGVENNDLITKIYRNDGPKATNQWTFTNVYHSLPGGTSAKWGDYDRDGDLDILLSSLQTPNKVWVYRNIGNGNFEALGTAIDQVGGSVIWCDYNNDGYPDIIMAGNSSGNVPVTKIFRNDPDGDNRKFTDIEAGLYGITGASLACCDYDGDGDADLLITGLDVNNQPRTILYDNLGNDHFEDSGFPFPGISHGSGQWGDAYRSGNPLLMLTGITKDPDHPELPGHNYSAVWENDPTHININKRPHVPNGLNYHIIGSLVVLSWQPATDAETPPGGLTYNLRIGTTPNGSEIMSALSDRSTGHPYLAAPGNTGHNTTWYINGLQPGRTYYWSVQAVDPQYAGSYFAEEKAFTVPAPYFKEEHFSISDIYRGDMAWGDYDRDGDLDLAISGVEPNGSEVTRLYKNENGTFTETGAGLADVWSSTLKWGDYDNDGDPDLFVAGGTELPGGSSVKIAKIYRNDGNGIFSEQQDVPMGVEYGDADWGDYDNDGDLDLIITGQHADEISIAQIFRNDSGIFHIDYTNIDKLEGVKFSSVAWQDYDRDGDLDLLLTGLNNDEIPVAKIYKNVNGIFTENTDVVLPGIYGGRIAWGDYDADGYPDILMSGSNKYGSDMYGVVKKPVMKIFHNDQHGNFVELYQTLDSIDGKVAWDDVDNDGDLDFVFTGTRVIDRLFTHESGVYINENGIFTKENIYFPEAYDLEPVDYDNDNRLDFAIMVGHTDITGSSAPFYFYHNKSDRANHPPEPPGNLQASYQQSMIALAWGPATDQETPAEGLSYNLRIGSAPGGSDILSAMADPATGSRQVVSGGNAGQNLFRRIFLPDSIKGPFYWSVQAIDNNMLASSFAAEQIVSIVPAHTITGEVFQMNHWPLYYSQVYVYKIENGEPVAVMNQRLNATNSFTLPEIPEGYVTIKVVPDMARYRDYITTYLGDTPFYSEAYRFYLDKDTSGLKIYVIKVEQNNTMGTIAISGSMTMSQSGGGKTISVKKGSSPDSGTPIPDVPVCLLNNKGEVIAGDVTDSLGNFSFDSIPVGHYSFYADYKGWPMDASNDSLILDQEGHKYEVSVSVAKDGIVVESVNDVTAVQNPEVEKQIVVFPNPVHDNVYLRFGEPAEGDLQIRLIGMDGAVYKTLRTERQTAGVLLRIPVSDLAPGLYILSVEGKRVSHKSRIVIMR